MVARTRRIAMCARAHLFFFRRAEQIMGMPAEAMRRWTAREVRELTERNPLWSPRYELVDGELLVTPSPGPFHQEAISSLVAALRSYLEREKVAHVLPSPSDVELETETVVQPDAYVMTLDEWRRVRRDGFPARELLLAIEVLSPSSGRYDRVTKRRLYQRRVGEYWIVDLDARMIERWWPGDERPEILTQALEWRPQGAVDPFRLDVPAFFRGVFEDEKPG